MHAPKKQSIKIYEAKIHRPERGNGQIHVIAGEFKTSLEIINKRNREKISKDRADLNGTIRQLDLINSYRILCPATEHTDFSSSRGNTPQDRPLSGP